MLNQKPQVEILFQLEREKTQKVSASLESIADEIGVKGQRSAATSNGQSWGHNGGQSKGAVGGKVGATLPAHSQSIWGIASAGKPKLSQPQHQLHLMCLRP